MAVWGVGIMFGPIVGPFMGGWLTDQLSWRWIFYVNIPIGTLALIMVYFFIYDPSYLRRVKERIDYWGLGLLIVGIGCLQTVLDRGEGEDWFESHVIVILSAVAVTSLIFFVLVELTTERPVVNLRAFKERTFAAGNLMMFFSFFCFFGSIVLLPLYLQLLMGYTATLAGMALSPGGIASLIAMAFVGRIIGKVDARYIMVFGIAVTSYSFYMMTQFNLFADYQYVLMPRIIQGFGVGCLFVPLTTVTLNRIPREEMGNATGIFNLLRNLGGSFGIAFSATMLSRHAQINHRFLIEHITPTNINFQQMYYMLNFTLPLIGIEPAQAEQATLGIIYKELQRQAMMLSFNDSFRYLFLIFFVVFPLLLLLRRPQHLEAGPMH
jgi:DHA2 family multidrug resistance protein